MRTWIATVVLVVVGSFTLASGCGNPDVVNPDHGPQSNAGSGGGSATGGTSGLHLGDAGDTGSSCPSTCEQLNANCGYVTDTRCGGIVNCGPTTCPSGEACGAIEPNRCGKGTSAGDGGVCTASTCAELDANCGAVTDTKCGGIVTCGKCPSGQGCGLGGANKCGSGDGGTCTVDPKTTCAGRGYTCGQAADNCGNVLDCGSTTCPNAGDVCIQGTCQPPAACVVDPKTTCAGRGYSCGQAADNCGNALTCGPLTCSTPGWTCGGGSDAKGNPIAGVCGCTGACSQIPTCPGATTTTLSGKVYDPAGKNPLYHVLVYIANNPNDPALKNFPVGTTCDVCGASAAGSPLVSTPGVTDPPAGTYTGVDGSFKLSNVPVGKGLTVVIQLGRWRRVFKVDVNNSCAANTIADKTLLMPSTQAQGNIPLMAMVTGKVDSLECVLRKMGIAASEFTDPAQKGRVQFYLGGDAPGQSIDAATPDQSALFQLNGTQPVIDNYDMTILSCQGQAYSEAAADQKALRAYAKSGGRIFATHFSYTWLYQNDENTASAGKADNWSEVASWHDDEADQPATAVGIIDKLSNPKGNAFQGWLEAVGASTVGSGKVGVIVIRHDTDLISAVKGKTQQWLYRDGDNARTCKAHGNTCTGTCSNVCSAAPNNLCNSNADCAPNVCKNRTQSTCNVDNDCIINGRNRGPCVPNTCVPDTCIGTDYTGEHTPLHFTFNTPVNLVQNLTKKPPDVQCGRVLFSDFHVQDAQEQGKTFPEQCGNACNVNADCTGTCTNNTCPWGSACKTDNDCASTCSGGRCLDPMNAQEKLLEFMIFDLGSCVPPPVTCVPATKCPAGQNCGYASDGCGKLIKCGDCPTGQACGVGDPPVPNQCGKVGCTPATTCPSGQVCGFASDGCNGVVSCGKCPTGQTCNGGKCGSTTCTAKTCGDQKIECGQAGDQCGNEITCPACPTGEACVGGKCVTQSCPPQSCTDQGIQCGAAADGCGQMLDCGQCGAGGLCVSGICEQVN